jgi:hypothetical protein
MKIKENTTLSTLSTIVVYIKTSISSENPISIILDLVELHLQTADNIVNQLIDFLYKSEFDDNFLKNNWISFVSDGASVLVGKKKELPHNLRINIL